jgi:hypothetical protein
VRRVGNPRQACVLEFSITTSSFDRVTLERNKNKQLEDGAQTDAT